MDFNRDTWIVMNILMTNLLIEFFLFEICTLYEIVIMTMTNDCMSWWKCHVMIFGNMVVSWWQR